MTFFFQTITISYILKNVLALPIFIMGVTRVYNFKNYNQWLLVTARTRVWFHLKK